MAIMLGNKTSLSIDKFLESPFAGKHPKLINEHSEQARAPHTNGPRDVPRCEALSLLQKTFTRFSSKPNGADANNSSRSVRAWRGGQNLSGAEVWAAAFRGMEEEGEIGGVQTDYRSTLW